MTKRIKVDIIDMRRQRDAYGLKILGAFVGGFALFLIVGALIYGIH